MLLQGDLVYRTGNIVNVPIGPGTLGRVLDALGQPIDGKGPLRQVRSSLVEAKAPGIVARQSVREPLFTGGTDAYPAICRETLTWLSDSYYHTTCWCGTIGSSMLCCSQREHKAVAPCVYLRVQQHGFQQWILSLYAWHSIDFMLLHMDPCTLLHRPESRGCSGPHRPWSARAHHR